MDTKGRRWPGAAAISIALHGALLLVAWLLLMRPGGGRVALFFDELELGRAPAFEPGAVVPVEITPVELPAPASDPAWAEPAVEPGPEPLDASASPADPPSRTLAGPVDAAERSEASASARASEQAPDPGAGVRDDPPRAAGLLASGREAEAGVDPRLLAGSRALYEAGRGGEVEGPRPRPGRSASAKDFEFERQGNHWVYRDPSGDFEAILSSDGSVEFKNKVVKFKVGSAPALSQDGQEFITLDIEHDAVALGRMARGREVNPRVKAQLLAATFDMRLELAIAHQKDRLIQRLGAIDDELRRTWYDSGLSSGERRRLLFELWDGCEEPGGELEGFPDADTSELDETRRKLARAARRKVIRFIGEVAPVGSDEAYSEAELAALNRDRVSKGRFDPYAE